MSRELAMEINDKETQINGTTARIVFHNSSTIKVVTASDSSRSNRANVLLLDEYRLIKKEIVDTVLRKFLTQKRTPRYAELSKEQRKIEYDKEKNLTLYLSSAFFQILGHIQNVKIHAVKCLTIQSVSLFVVFHIN